MPRRVLPLVVVVVGVVTLLFLAACVSRPLRHPVILGASASAGLGAEVDYRGRPTHVDMESVLRAAVARAGSDPVMLADPSFYVNPDEVAGEQIEAAAAARPTLIIAVDYLFWSVYGARFIEPSSEAASTSEDSDRAGAGPPERAAEERPSRLESLDAALATLDRFGVPIVVGDIPDVSASADKGMPGSWIPAPGEIAEANERIGAWASQRGNVVLLPIADLVRAEEGSGDGPEADAATGALMQDDHLHPTARGLVTICLAALKELEARGVIKPADYHADEAEVLDRLPLRAWRVERSRRAGPMVLLRLLSLNDEFEEAMQAKDCEKGATVGQELLEAVSQLRTRPHSLAGIGAWMTVTEYAAVCPDAGVQILRWREQLTPKVLISRPDPWPLELWSILNDVLGQERVTLDRLLEVHEQMEDLSPYEQVVGDLYSEFARTAPAEVMRLIPDIAPRLNDLNSYVASAFEQSKKPIEHNKWRLSMEKLRREVGRAAGKSQEQIEQDIRDMYDPLVQLENRLADLAIDYAELERALRAADRTAEADEVHAAAEEAIRPDRYAAGRRALEEEIAEDAAKAKVMRAAQAGSPRPAGTDAPQAASP